MALCDVRCILRVPLRIQHTAVFHGYMLGETFFIFWITLHQVKFFRLEQKKKKKKKHGEINCYAL